MPEIVITEFMDADAVARLHKSDDCHVDPTLWESNERTAALLADCRALIVRNKTQVTRELLDCAPKLIAVGRLGVGLDNIDVAACRERGVAVYPATGSNAVSVAEYVMTAALVLRRASFQATAAMTAGAFPRETLSRGREVNGATLGIVGLGSIGSLVARRARAFDMHVIAADAALPDDHANWQLAARTTPEALLAEADILTLHVPLTGETRNMIDAGVLQRMKPGAIVINTSRGGVVDEAAVANALRSGHLAGAALDVFEKEPIDPATGALFAGIENLILTPHISGVTRESNVRTSNMIADLIGEHLANSSGGPA